MPRSDNLNRTALLSELVRRAPEAPGRTALMKFLFFLKVLKGLPLPYDFRLYTYGPFDSAVLDDLQYAQSLGAVKSTLVSYPGGSGYEYRSAPAAQEIEAEAREFLDQHRESVVWVLNEFGRRSAIDLEMASTLVYIDRSMAEHGRKQSLDELVRKTREVKPHLLVGAIEQEARSLKERGFLVAVT